MNKCNAKESMHIDTPSEWKSAYLRNSKYLHWSVGAKGHTTFPGEFSCCVFFLFLFFIFLSTVYEVYLPLTAFFFVPERVFVCVYGCI